jgi:hypothetical protein
LIASHPPLLSLEDKYIQVIDFKRLFKLHHIQITQQALPKITATDFPYQRGLLTKRCKL